MTDWATAATARTEMQRWLLKLYDDNIDEGFTRKEARAIAEGGILTSEHPGLWPLIRLWLDEERP